ncbi:GrpB family protein [Bacillus infantis]|uniref:GrpB family protein n=1 Tax=Bacillus infantis TaxID=324767 RepID=UPI001CD64D9D|nr:GrpB family protein [Bacillus infantis]MCA1039718.1 GrpB family protein [Bacillus infantis]
MMETGPRKVEVVPYCESWAISFQEEKQLLAAVFGESAAIHHIGSTSIPGMSAKPIIDILAEADSAGLFDEAAPELQGWGYIAKGENGIPGRRYFVRFTEAGERLVHLHCYPKGHPEIGRHLLFRDYLQKHPEEAGLYSRTKLEAARKYPYDIESYIKEKDPVVKLLDEKALDWRLQKKEKEQDLS